VTLRKCPLSVSVTVHLGLFSIHKKNVFYVEINCQLDATEVFIADLIACSTCFGHHYAHHQELKSIIQWLLRVVFGAVKMKKHVEQAIRSAIKTSVASSWQFISTY